MNPITYHPFGLPTGWTWGNGTPYTRTLDLDGRISAYPLGNTIHSVSYDPASRITEITGTSTRSYGYDPLDRLTSYTAPAITQTYGYDANGNRLTETLGAQATSYSYTPGSNRLQSRTQGTAQIYTYDPAGNLIADGAHTYTYDARGRMVQATTGALSTSYRYNGLGERVSKTAPGISRRFVYDDTGHLIGEYDAAGAPIQETVYLGDLPIAVLSGPDSIHYVHADQIDTPRALTDSQGTVAGAGSRIRLASVYPIKIPTATASRSPTTRGCRGSTSATRPGCTITTIATMTRRRDDISRVIRSGCMVG